MKKQTTPENDLSGCIDVSSLVQQQASHLSVAFLGCQVEGADTLLGQDVGLSSVLQQR